MVFVDRADAGRRLATGLAGEIKGPEPLLVLAIPRGGIVVGAEVAAALHARLGVWVSRKIGAPHNPELAIGSVDGFGELFLDHDLVRIFKIGSEYLAREISAQRGEALRRMRFYGQTPETLRLVSGSCVVVVDDGIATGATALSAVRSLRKAGALRIILAVPVASTESMETLAPQVDKLVVLHTPAVFNSVGSFYEHFDQVEDAEALEILERARTAVAM